MPQSPINILLIEDDEDDYVITKDLITDAYGNRFKLDWQKNYHEGLNKIKSRGFDVCLIDYRLGAFDGLQLLAEAGCHNSELPVPVIMLTGQDDRSLDMAAMRAGAADFLVKGKFDAQLLERSIRYTMERAALLQKLSELATHDELTRVYNRREIVRLLNLECKRSDRSRDPFSIILMDIDHFKQINDTHGHQSGDNALKVFAQILIDKVRGMDCIGRYGGDEFIIILPNTQAKDALIVAERIRLSVSETPFVAETTDGYQHEFYFTISMGIAEFPENGNTVDTLVRSADEAHYFAKHAGRNRCVLFQKSELTEVNH